MIAAAAKELGRARAAFRKHKYNWFSAQNPSFELSETGEGYASSWLQAEFVQFFAGWRAAAESLLAERAALVEEIERLRRELMAAVVADQEHGAGMSIILRNWRSRGKSDGDWRALDVSVQFGVGQPEISVISEYLCEGGVIDHAVHPGGIASARALVGGQADG